MSKYNSKIVLIAVCFALFVVMLGAYTRLTNAGLGCPDWPGCYGHMIMPSESKTLGNAQAAFPENPIESTKAWTEMAHRYAAGSLGLFILFIAYQAIQAYRRQQAFPRFVPFLLLGLLFFQAALGMWTVTLKLLPVVVMGHLLGGISILACLWWCYLALSSENVPQANKQLNHFKPWIIAGFIIVFCQIALGGWVSANYAGLSCIGFPQCNGIMLPELDLTNAFNLASPIGANYQGGILNTTSRITIQFVHRIGAMVTFFYVLCLSAALIRYGHTRLKKAASIAFVLVIIQFSLGIINVMHLLPLKIAVAHNGVAALLLLSMLAQVYFAWQAGAKHE